MLPFTTFPRNTNIMLVLLSVFVLNLTWGAAHVAFEHDSFRNHRHEAGHSHNQPEPSPHSTQDHAQEMLLPRARLLMEEMGIPSILPLQTITVPDAHALAVAVEWVEAPCVFAAWKQPPWSNRGPPKAS